MNNEVGIDNNSIDDIIYINQLPFNIFFEQSAAQLSTLQHAN